MAMNEAVDSVKVLGLKEFKAKLATAGREIPKDFNREIKLALKPVATTATEYAVARISHMGTGRPWSKFRIGVFSAGAYMAPQQRGVSAKQSRAQRRGRYARSSGAQLAGLSRPNLSPLLLERAMEPALETNRPLILARVDRIIKSHL